MAVNAPSAAEAAAFSAAYDKAIYCRVVLGEILHGPKAEWEQQLAAVPSVAAKLTDSNKKPFFSARV